MNRVGILMSLYRPDQRLLETCLQSVAKQTFKDWHLYIVLDGIAESDIPLCISDIIPADKFSLLVIHRNVGLTLALNHGSMGIDAEFIARVDDDDMWLESHLEDSIELFDSDPNIFLTGSFFCLNKNNSFDEVSWPERLATYRPFFGGAYFAHSTLIYRINKFRDLGGYASYQRKAQDRELVCSVIFRFGRKSIGTIKKSNVVINVREDSISRSGNQRLYSILARMSYLRGRLPEDDASFAISLIERLLKYKVKNKVIVAVVTAILLFWKR